ncbi:POU domain protein [Aphelenchoides besseyi]|nr:POU domain protein [Aphelenchoides besseyi]
MNPSQRIYPSLNSFQGMDRYSPTPYRQRMQQTSSIFGALEDPFLQSRAAQAAQALVEIDVKNVNMSANMLRPTDMFTNYHSQNLLNNSNSDLIDNTGIPPNSTNLIDSQSNHTNSSDTMNSLQQVMAMQHHYPGASAHFHHYHQLPQASVAGVAAAFGAPHSSGMNLVGGNATIASGFIGNPLNNMPNNNILPRYSLSHPTTTPEIDTDPRELERFAEHFKQRRIKLGVTQADVGKALAHLKMPGVGSLSQSTICRFESLTLSHNNMVALKPILHSWLEKAEDAIKNKAASSDVIGILPSSDKKRKRTSIAAPEKRLLEDYFRQQPRPTGDRISAIAEKLDLKKNVVRVWFCNQRQKQKRQFRCRSQTTNGLNSLHNCQAQPQQTNNTEVKYNPNAVDVKRQILAEDLFQQNPAQSTENISNSL